MSLLTGRLQTLGWIAEVVGPETPVVIARELTKVHEEYLRGTARGLHELMAGHPTNG